jgi:hypothetical protein
VRRETGDAIWLNFFLSCVSYSWHSLYSVHEINEACSLVYFNPRWERTKRYDQRCPSASLMYNCQGRADSCGCTRLIKTAAVSLGNRLHCFLVTSFLSGKKTTTFLISAKFQFHTLLTKSKTAKYKAFLSWTFETQPSDPATSCHGCHTPIRHWTPFRISSVHFTSLQRIL